MSAHHIMAVMLNNRIVEAPRFQETLTKHGCIIKMRLGLHETNNSCSRDGLILLHLDAEESAVQALEQDLSALEGVRHQRMALDFSPSV